MDRVFGIDISLYQKGFDFAKAKSEGVRFAILKCSQEDYKDPQLENHYKAAKAAGIPVGAYHYTRARDAAAARAEAKTCIAALAGKVFEYPVFFDIEDAVHKKLTKAQNDEIIRAFCTELEAAGYWAGFYCNYDFYKNYCSGEALAKRFSLWLASWGASAPAECQMWQFGGETNIIRSNKVAGVVCDQNFALVDYPAMIKEVGANGFPKKATAAAPKPAPVPKPTPVATPAPAPTASETVYTVVAGDTLSGIAARYGTTYQKLAAYNGIANPNVIYAGQKIKIPGTAKPAAPAAPAKSIDEIAREVIRGVWGNGQDRKNRLTKAGYDYNAVQARVDVLGK